MYSLSIFVHERVFAKGAEQVSPNCGVKVLRIPVVLGVVLTLDGEFYTMVFGVLVLVEFFFNGPIIWRGNDIQIIAFVRSNFIL